MCNIMRVYLEWVFSLHTIFAAVGLRIACVVFKSGGLLYSTLWVFYIFDCGPNAIQ